MMRRRRTSSSSYQSRETERGAALVSVLLISALLLTAGGAVLLTTSMSAANPRDAVAEAQAYYAAEAGLQRTLNVMRSKDLPPGTIPGGKSKLTFRDIALNPTLSNWIPSDGPVINQTQTTLVGTNAFSVAVTDPDDPGPALTQEITLNASYQPARLNIQLIGYGPKRARKILNMIVFRSKLSGFQAPATITLRGSDADPPPSLTLDTGSSSDVRYTGNDAAGGSGISAFAVTVPDVAPTLLGIQSPTQVIGPPVSVLGPVSPVAGVPPTPEPEFLKTADTARDFVQELKDEAVGQSRHFTTKPATENMGTEDAPQFTFVEGDVELGPGHQGTGFLVVTGNLSMHGDTSFDGVIFVLGGGSVTRSGSGGGTISGGIVVARFGPTGGFQPPSFVTDGGGNSLIQYDSSAFANAMGTLPGFQVVGVAEK